MRYFGKNLVIGVAALLLVGGVGCKKKKPNVPPAVQPPTITQPEPEKPPVEAPKEEPTVIVPPVTQPSPEPTPPAPKPKPHRKKKTAPQPATTGNDAKPSAAKPGTPAPKSGTEAKPGETNVQISAEVPQNVANQRRQQTEDLLNVAEANLKKISRTLNDGEQSMQRQVRNFITQSRLAIQDGDFERAYNLATKAQQLSQELVK